MVYSLATRENAVSSADTATALTELGGNSPGTVDVPAASMLTGVYINVGLDATQDDHFGYSSAIRLSGSGIAGYQSYPGPCGFTTAHAATYSGAAGASAATQKYKTAIPVISGQGIDVEGFMHGEDAGELHMAVTLEFDGVPGVCRDFDYREENLTAANTKVTLGAKLGATHAYIQPSTMQIGEIHVNGGVKAAAGATATVVEYELFGPALPSGGSYEFIGHSYLSSDDLDTTTAAPGSNGCITSTAYHIPRGKLRLKAGNKFQAQAQMLEDDVGTVYAIIGIGYC